jgi:hypothetical protein
MLNIFTNHQSNYLFEYGIYDGDIKVSLSKFLKEYCGYVEEIEFDFEIMSNWQKNIWEILEYYFLEVFKMEYTKLDSSADYHRQHCIDSFIKLLEEFFRHDLMQVWISGRLGSGKGSCIEEYFPYEISTDIIFIFNNNFYLLHLGVFD